MFWLKLVTNFIKILREGQTPAQVAGGFALGSILGLSPMFTLQGILVWFVILVLDVNLSAATFSLGVFALIAYIFDPLFHRLGYFLLANIEGLRALWTALYNAPLAPLTRFNNTVVLGSFVSALILFTPIYLGMKKFVIVYRATLGVRIRKMKVYQIIDRSSLVQWYRRVRDLGSVL
ncbi:MAG: TIGR03546 family protein [Ignavibacteriae bacterium]|nr:MAG: TIGR03546 family protein [Ignavibacteriota bacterium]